VRLAGSFGLAAVVATFAGCTWGTYTPEDGGLDSNGVDSGAMDSGQSDTSSSFCNGSCGPGANCSNCPLYCGACTTDGGGTGS
jgi:hypothetical protein